MKESMNLKQSKNNNLLTVVYVDDLKREEALSQAFYTFGIQSYKSDLLVFHPKLSKGDMDKLVNILEKPILTVKKKDKDGKEESEVFEPTDPINYKLLEITSQNFSQLFNLGFNIAFENDYELYCIVEQEDVLNANWFDYVNTYSQENENFDIFVPIIRNTVNGIFSGFLNEASWAENLSEEAGKFDSSLLTRFNCVVPLGAVYKIKSLVEYAEQKEDKKYYPFKESIKLAHFYEFFLRMVYNDLKVVTIPRIGYEMKIIQQDFFKETSTKIPQHITSIAADKGGCTQDEAQFWMELVKKEYFFDEDRKKTYVSKEG